MLDFLKKLLMSEKTKGIVSMVAAVVMYFTPDDVDRIIESLLAAFGARAMFIKQEDDDSFVRKS
jgi:O-methyltransferase involved in polyketide biosynthesis